MKTRVYRNTYFAERANNGDIKLIFINPRWQSSVIRAYATKVDNGVYLNSLGNNIPKHITDKFREVANSMIGVEPKRKGEISIPIDKVSNLLGETIKGYQVDQIKITLDNNLNANDAITIIDAHSNSSADLAQLLNMDIHIII